MSRQSGSRVVSDQGCQPTSARTSLRNLIDLVHVRGCRRKNCTNDGTHAQMWSWLFMHNVHQSFSRGALALPA